MLQRVRDGLWIAIVCLALGACGASTPAGGTAPKTTATTAATATVGATAAPPTATNTPGTGGTGTAPLAINCGQIFQNPDHSVAPPAPNYGGITRCFTGAFTGCQPSFLEYIGRGSDSTSDLTLTIVKVKGVCQIYVNDHEQSIKGTENRYFYYCTTVTQLGDKAVLTKCDTHYTNGTISIPN
jgi:hypothetical protein